MKWLSGQRPNNTRTTLGQLVSLLLLFAGHGVAVAEDKILFDFADVAGVKDWQPVVLAEVREKQPAVKIEIVKVSTENCLRLTFAGGDWPTVGTTRIPVTGNWQQFLTLNADLTVILNWFRAKGTISSGVVEGLNYNAKLTMKKAYGYRTAVGIKIALYHRLGALPEPEFTHRFW